MLLFQAPHTWKITKSTKFIKKISISKSVKYLNQVKLVNLEARCYRLQVIMLLNESVCIPKEQLMFVVRHGNKGVEVPS